MSQVSFDITAFVGLHEGQHFDRKSLFDRQQAHRRPRDRRAVRDQVAEYVAAFANAEGGVLILGIEDDGERTGHAYPADAVTTILRTPVTRLAPPQPEGFRVHHAGAELLVFDVPSADGPVQVVGDGFPLRIGDRTVQASESQIQALKLHGLGQSYEARPATTAVEDLDRELVSAAANGAGVPAIGTPGYLLKRKLADMRGRQVVLRRSAELLFAKNGPDHPNAGIRIFRVVGTERRTGPEHNVEELPRIEGPLPRVLTDAFRVIDSLVRRPSRLVGNRFRPVPEYPEFSWKEAVLNAMAHRDYGIEGRSVEVWLFDDRLEVSSPGGLLPEAPLEDLLALRRVHASRNPRTVRALVDLGFMREQGEGIPRMFAEMAGQFLPAPTIDAGPREFRVTLRNTPTLTAEDRKFVASLGSEELTDQEFRALLEASRHGRVDNARIREITGLDTLGASTLLRRLRDRGLLHLHPAGSASYYELAEPAASAAARPHATGTRDASGARPEDLARAAQGPTVSARQLELIPPETGADAREPHADTQELAPDTRELAPDTQELAPDTQELAADTQELDVITQELIANLGPRPRQAALRALVLRVCASQPRRAVSIARILGLKDVAWLVRKHLIPMVAAGQLSWTHPDTPTHPGQAYRTVTTAGGAAAQQGAGPR